MNAALQHDLYDHSGGPLWSTGALRVFIKHSIMMAGIFLTFSFNISNLL